MKHYLTELLYSIYRIFAIRYCKKYLKHYRNKLAEVNAVDDVNNYHLKVINYMAAINEMEAEQALRDYKQNTLK